MVSTLQIKGFRRGTPLFLLVLGFMANLGYGQAKNQIAFFAGLNHVLQYGCKEDYVFGENDFPVTPAHTPPALGLSYARFFSRKIGFELDFRYNLSSKLTLEDPSDGDEIKIDCSKHFALTGNLIYQILNGRLRPYLLVGAGFDTLSDVKDQTVISELGYEVTLMAPEKKSDFLADAGIGILYFIDSNLGMRFDIRYIFIPKTDDHPAINSINVCIGGFKRF